MIVLFTLLLSSLHAQENRIYVMSADAPTSAFKAQLEVESQSKTYIDFYLTEKPQWSKVQKLQQTFEAAQKSYLTQTIKESLEQFEKVVEQRFDEDWDPPQIKMIHYALLRMAQHDSRKEFWLEEAIKWSSDMEPDADLFPPTFVVELQNRKQKMKMATFDLTVFKQNNEIVIINGEWIQSQDFIMRPEGVYRLTVVSNRYLPLSLKGTFKDLSAKMVSRTAFVRGSCANPDWTSSVQGQNLKAFFSAECQIALRENKKKPLDLNPAPVLVQNTLSETYPSPQSTTILDSKWFWIGAAVVGGFIAYKQFKPQKRDTEPSTQEGF